MFGSLLASLFVFFRAVAVLDKCLERLASASTRETALNSSGQTCGAFLSRAMP